MKCTNCGAAVARDSSVCPECGVFTGRQPAARQSARWPWLAILLFVAVAAAGWWFLRPAPPRFDTVRSHAMVQGGSGGAKAVVALRYHLVTKLKIVQSECLAVISHGYTNGYYSFDAVDSCARTKLGRWKVDADSGRVLR